MVNMSQAILDGASLVDNVRTLKVKDEQRQIDRQYMREDAARKRQVAQAQLDSQNIANRVNTINANNTEFQLEELKRQANLRDRANVHRVVADTFNRYPAGVALQNIFNDKYLMDEFNRLYPDGDWGNYRPVDISMVNPEVLKTKVNEIARTNAIKRNEGLVQTKSIVDGKEVIKYEEPEVTAEDIQYAKDSLVIVSDSTTGDIKMFDGNITASILFGDVMAQAEYNRQQETARQEALKAQTDNAIALTKAQAEDTKAKADFVNAQLNQAKYATDLQNQNTALQLLQLPDIKSVKTGNGSMEVQKVTNNVGGVEMAPGQAQQAEDYYRKIFGVIQQGINPDTEQPFADSKEMIDTLQSAGTNFMAALKARGLTQEEAAKQYEQQITTFLKESLVNGNIEDPTLITQFYYTLTGKKVDNNTLGQLKALKMATRYINDPNKLTEDKIGIVDTPVRNFMSMISDALPKGFQEEIYKDASARLANSDLITTVLTASLGSQITKNELKLYDISPSLFDSFSDYKAKLQTALNAMEDRANAMVLSDDLIVSAEGELLLKHLQKYREGMARIEAFSTAKKDKWFGSGNNLKEIVLSEGNDVANNQALSEARAKGHAILFKSNGKSYFIPASKPGDTSTTAQPILISENEAQQLRQFKVKK